MPRINPKDGGLSAWWAVREIDHLFGRFARYTRFVVYSKRSLVVVALALIISLIAWPILTKDRSGLRVSFVDVNSATKKAESPVMNNPEYLGTGENGQEYRVTGKTATQRTPTLVVIDAVEAKMLKENGSWYVLNADRAEFQQDKKLIDLFDNVSVVDAKATRFTTSRATIETQTSHVYGSEPIRGDGPMGKLVASGFEITDNGNHIIFVGGALQLRVTVERKKK